MNTNITNSTLAPAADQQPGYGERLVQSAPQVTVALAIGIALGWFGHVLTSRREGKARVRREKDAFGVFIRKQIAALPQRQVREFYESTKPTIREAVSQVWHFLDSEDKRNRLDRLWREYNQIPAQEFDSKHEGAMGEMVRRLHQTANPPAEFQTPCEIVKYYLDEFYKLSA